MTVPTPKPSLSTPAPFGYLPAPDQIPKVRVVAVLDPIRIYVACLASYVNGQLHGEWIDATQGVEHIQEHVAAMLKRSPQPDAEEWAIHDYEGFEGAPISEYGSFETIANYAEFIEEHGELGGKVIENFNGDLDEATSAFENYYGEYSNLAAYAENFTEETGVEIPKSLVSYIDYAAMGRDMELSGDIITFSTAFDEIHIFGRGE